MRSPALGHLLWHRIAERVADAPGRTAVRDGTRTLSYGELWEASGRMAAWLAARGVGRGDRLAMILPKSVECVVTMLGALRAGVCYVPIDPRAPAARQAFVLRDARVRAVVARGELLASVGEHVEAWRPEAVLLSGRAGAPAWCDGAAVADLATLPEAQAPAVHGAHEGDPAYILYTSGSTGTPKGVVIGHRTALTFVEWGIAAFGLSDADVLSNHAPHHFDLSVFDIYGALHVGAVVSIVPDRVNPFPATLAKWIESEGITVWYSVPSALIRLLTQGALEGVDYPRLRAVLFAGEPFPVKYLREVMDRIPGATFHNLFGPTETNVCTWYEVPRPLPASIEQLPIGRVCANMDGIILREDGTRAAAGEEGELLIGGPGVMLGYWGLPERTAAVRIQNPLHGDFADPVLRTGDRVSEGPDGQLVFHGRRDHMVKTRGYRVELGEIETALLAHPSVGAACAAALPDAELGSRIAALVAPADGATVDAGALTVFLLERLARYAVPELLLVRPELPLTSTGKADRTAVTAALLEHQRSHPPAS